MTTEAQQIKTYGCTIAQLESDLPDYLIKDSGSDLLLYAMSIISDAQHMLEMGDAETSRQFMNKAKYYVSQVHSDIRLTEIKECSK